MTIIIDEPATKYETKRTGLTCDEALEATVLGYRARAPSMCAGAYIHYPGEGGWRIQFVHDGREGSSCGWEPDRSNWLEDWEIVPLPSEVKRDAWGVVVTGLPVDDPRNPNRDSWGRPINGIA